MLLEPFEHFNDEVGLVMIRMTVITMMLSMYDVVELVGLVAQIIDAFRYYVFKSVTPAAGVRILEAGAYLHIRSRQRAGLHMTDGRLPAEPYLLFVNEVLALSLV